MKKRLLIMIIIATLILACSCSINKNSNQLKIGKYVYYEVENGFAWAWVILEENNEFEFNRGISTSYCPRGSYSIQEDELILKVDDTEQYKFKIDEKKLVFESGTDIGNLLEKGAVFQFSDKDE